MPYRRGGFALTPPSLTLFLISVVLALIALLTVLAMRLFRPKEGTT